MEYNKFITFIPQKSFFAKAIVVEMNLHIIITFSSIMNLYQVSSEYLPNSLCAYL